MSEAEIAAQEKREELEKIKDQKEKLKQSFDLKRKSKG